MIWCAFAMLTLAAFMAPAVAVAQGKSSSAVSDAGTESGRSHILLVLPFDNASETGKSAALSPLDVIPPQPNQTQPGQPSVSEGSTLDWIREAVPEILNSRFASAGFLPLSREDRLYALDHLGMPEALQPSRATAVRLAETLDADSIIFGSYSVSGTTLTLRARLVDVPHLRLSEEITQSGQFAQLLPLLNSLAWKITRRLDPGFGVAEETFRAADAGLRLDAFEQYIRGLTDRERSQQLRHLKKATELNPNFSEAWLATGRLQFSGQEYEQAAVSFAKVTRGDPSELEAHFYRGLALIYSGNYAKAEDSFAAVARVLPLPEVVNNEAVAVSRRGHDAIALFRQAAAADPTDADYHFNLAVSLHQHGDKAEAIAELDQCLRLRNFDSEARVLEDAWKDIPSSKPALDKTIPDEGSANSAAAEPLERIKRSYNGSAFRQAALMLDQVEAAHLAALPASERAVRLNKTAHEKLDRGLLLEAEREYQAALSADNNSAEAHAGLAEVRERAGDFDSARGEARASIDRKPNVEAYLVLARLDLAANRLPDAREEAAQALRLDSSSRAARDLRKSIDARIEAHNMPAPPAGQPAPAVTPAAPKQ